MNARTAVVPSWYMKKKKTLICPSCDGENIAPKQAKPLPQWIIEKNNVKPG